MGNLKVWHCLFQSFLFFFNLVIIVYCKWKKRTCELKRWKQVEEGFYLYTAQTNQIVIQYSDL